MFAIRGAVDISGVLVAYLSWTSLCVSCEVFVAQPKAKGSDSERTHQPELRIIIGTATSLLV